MDSQGLSPPPLAVQCQFHAGQPFTAVCQRCGTYMCSVCTEGGRFTQCAACRERTGVGNFPFDRNSYTLGALFEFAWEAYKKQWVPLVIGVLITFACSGLFNALGSVLSLPFADNPIVVGVIQVIMFIPQFALQGLFTLGMIKLSTKVVRGEKVELAELFSCWNRVGAWFVQTLILGLVATPVIVLFAGAVYLASLASDTMAAIAGLLLGIPMFIALIWAGLGVAYANFELATQPDVGAVSALYNSWNIARERRLDTFLTGLASGAVYLLGVIACCVGLLWSAGVAGCMFAALYVALRNGAQNLRTS